MLTNELPTFNLNQSECLYLISISIYNNNYIYNIYKYLLIMSSLSPAASESSHDKTSSEHDTSSTQEPQNMTSDQLVSDNVSIIESLAEPLLSSTLQKSESNVQKVTIHVGSRESKLALIQTRHVIKCLEDLHNNQPDVKVMYDFKIETMKTIGDKILDQPLPEIGDKGLFTQELEESLLEKRVDLIVHSLKDLPTTLPFGCCIGAILMREDPNDGLILKSGLHLDNPFDLISGKHKLYDENGTQRNPVIGTSSLRRKSQLKHYNPSIEVSDVRGNISTRLEKLDGLRSIEGKKGTPVPNYDALILAVSGLTRAGDGFVSRISSRLGSDGDDDDHPWFYAVGQGALAVECRSDDEMIHSLLRPLMDYQTVYEILAERSLMYHLEGGCSVPIGVRSQWISSKVLRLTGTVFSSDGSQVVKSTQDVTLIRRLSSFESEAQATDAGSEKMTSSPEVKKRKFDSECISEFFKKENVCCGLRNPSCPILSHNFMRCFIMGQSLSSELSKMGADVILKKIKEEKEIRKQQLMNDSKSSNESSFETL